LLLWVACYGRREGRFGDCCRLCGTLWVLCFCKVEWLAVVWEIEGKVWWGSNGL
jgi:hypothetical protein